MSQKSQEENTREALEFVNYTTPGLTITSMRLNMGIFRLNEARYFTLFLIMQFPDTIEKRCCKWYAFVRKTINYSYSWEEITSFSFWSVLASTANFLTRILSVLSPEWIFLNAHVLRMFFSSCTTTSLAVIIPLWNLSFQETARAYQTTLITLYHA